MTFSLWLDKNSVINWSWISLPQTESHKLYLLIDKCEMKLIRRESDCSYIYDAATGSEVFLLFF